MIVSGAMLGNFVSNGCLSGGLYFEHFIYLLIVFRYSDFYVKILHVYNHLINYQFALTFVFPFVSLLRCRVYAGTGKQSLYAVHIHVH